MLPAGAPLAFETAMSSNPSPLKSPTPTEVTAVALGTQATGELPAGAESGA